MGSRRMCWLNPDTHSNGASSTASLVFRGARRWIVTVAVLPMARDDDRAPDLRDLLARPVAVAASAQE